MRKRKEEWGITILKLFSIISLYVPILCFKKTTKTHSISHLSPVTTYLYLSTPFCGQIF